MSRIPQDLRIAGNPDGFRQDLDGAAKLVAKADEGLILPPKQPGPPGMKIPSGHAFMPSEFFIRAKTIPGVGTCFFVLFPGLPPIGFPAKNFRSLHDGMTDALAKLDEHVKKAAEELAAKLDAAPAPAKPDVQSKGTEVPYIDTSTPAEPPIPPDPGVAP